MFSLLLPLPLLLLLLLLLQVFDLVLEALESNTRVEALYCQNFDQGMADEQLDRLGRLLQRRCIWALCAGEHRGASAAAWQRFAAALPLSDVAYLSVGEAHLTPGSGLRESLQQAIQANLR